MRAKIKLPIFFNTEETYQKEELGIETSLEEAELKHTTFYSIDVITPYIENDNEYCKIYAGGSEFICSLPVKEVEKLVEKIKYI
jgi:hypothetical protein